MTATTLESSPRYKPYFFLKRGVDFLVSALLLLILLPVFLVVAAIIKYQSPGPVLYAAPRVGLNGVIFKMLKFRTMVINADKIGGSSTPEDDPRVTKIGKALRRYKLDELPQLINVFRGEMSLVGPRPQIKWAVDLYTPAERKILTVRPGITDMASLMFANEGSVLKGSADPDKDYMALIHPHKMKVSLDYVETYSFIVDLQILIKTVAAVLGYRSYLFYKV
jgi:lipopolysaccharide/colanic/teichoic acid biosynthesis glycosyltransferase